MTTADIVIYVCGVAGVLMVCGAVALAMRWVVGLAPWRIPGKSHKQDSYGYILPLDYHASHGRRK
jgi:hypothetical protein